jgi:hypothetical protein
MACNEVRRQQWMACNEVRRQQWMACNEVRRRYIELQIGMATGV